MGLKRSSREHLSWPAPFRQSLSLRYPFGRRLLVSLCMLSWLAGVVDAANHIASFASYPLGLHLLTGLMMGPAGTSWAAMKESGVLVDTVAAPNLARQTVICWPLATLLLLVLLIALISRQLSQMQAEQEAANRPPCRMRRKRKNHKRRRQYR